MPETVLSDQTAHVDQQLVHQNQGILVVLYQFPDEREHPFLVDTALVQQLHEQSLVLLSQAVVEHLQPPDLIVGWDEFNVLLVFVGEAIEGLEAVGSDGRWGGCCQHADMGVWEINKRGQ